MPVRCVRTSPHPIGGDVRKAHETRLKPIGRMGIQNYVRLHTKPAED